MTDPKDTKDTKKLNAEELEKRVAPLALTTSDPTQDPTTSFGTAQGRKPVDPKSVEKGGGDGTGGGGKVYVP